MNRNTVSLVLHKSHFGDYNHLKTNDHLFVLDRHPLDPFETFLRLTRINKRVVSRV